MRATKKLQQFALIVAAAALCPTMAHAEETWPCEVVLCSANPKGPTALKECEEPMRKAWKAWSKGKKIPSCKRKDASGGNGGELSANEGALQEKPAEPDKNCPFTYYATRNQYRYCLYTGVQEQWIDGKLWGRIWYGGPTAQPYIEQLVEDPNNPRPPQAIVSDWPAMKADIEAKAAAAAQAYKAWEAAENDALLAMGKAALAAHQATTYAQELASLEASLPGQIAGAIAYANARDAAESAFQPKLQAAEAAAKKPGATAADIAAYNQAKSEALTLYYLKQGAINQVTNLQTQQAQLPQMHQQAQQLATIAAQAQAVADQKKAFAQARKSEADAADAAAQPLPRYFSTEA
ncbi:hypothetical protein HLB44_30705 [Aquincola sp. S2]|uniref:DUF2799 domain-containing protein n=1 Tax=Pseudaquabacterium terrae TaxID=2732868 RepID=A0ABX2ESF5_9BURK|nr:hypothetical protein [Aquabacterium terrae]NRF71364.1 hypothetical protein [Aquabacterium terrae]